MSKSVTLLWLPPPLIVVITAVLMGLTQHYLLTLQPNAFWASQSWNVLGQGAIALGISATALVIMLLAAHTLHKARTTLLPFVPERASALVTSGIFRYSRNPIYVADALLLLAWLFWLGQGVNLLWFGLFLLYMTKVQISAEEHALANKFAGSYQAYCQAVRRWL